MRSGSTLSIKFLFSCISILMIAGVYVGSNKAANFSSTKLTNQSAEPRVILASGQAASQFAYLDEQEMSYPYGQILGATTETSATGSARSLVVLYYHGITETSEGNGVTWQNFKNQMYLLKKNGYSTITLKQAKNFLLGKENIPQKSILLTFDDGRKDSYYPVDPVLKEIGYNAVMFVITSTLEKPEPYYLNVSEYQQMINSGRWELESHGDDGHKLATIDAAGTQAHWFANKLWISEKDRIETDEEYRDRITKDLRLSKQKLSDYFHVASTSFAIPFGDFAQNESNYADATNIFKEVMQGEFELVFYQPWNEDAIINFQNQQDFMIKRIGVEHDWTDLQLLHSIEKNTDKPLSFVDNFSTDHGWVEGWGSATVKSSGLKLIATRDTTGATAYLIGTNLWQDYIMNVTAINNETTESFSILSKVDESRNYIECQYSRTGVALRVKKDDEVTQITKWKTDLNHIFDTPQTYGISVLGDEVNCLLNETRMVSDKVDGADTKAGLIGLSIWSSDKNKAEARIVNVNARQNTETDK